MDKDQTLKFIKHARALTCNLLPEIRIVALLRGGLLVQGTLLGVDGDLPTRYNRALNPLWAAVRSEVEAPRMGDAKRQYLRDLEAVLRQEYHQSQEPHTPPLTVKDVLAQETFCVKDALINGVSVSTWDITYNEVVQIRAVPVES